MAGSTLTWQSKRQLTVAKSSIESEYVSLSTCTSEAVWLGRLLAEVGLAKPHNTTLPLGFTSNEIQHNLQLALPIFCDNQSAIKIAKNPVFHARTKHIEVHHHFVRENVLAGEIKGDYISTDQQSTDIFTKPLSRQKFEQHRDRLGIISLSSRFPRT
jgi:hypothetical protein